MSYKGPNYFEKLLKKAKETQAIQAEREREATKNKPTSNYKANGNRAFGPWILNK